MSWPKEGSGIWCPRVCTCKVTAPASRCTADRQSAYVIASARWPSVALVRAGASFTRGKLVERPEDKQAQPESA
jgi:hypothetical protein